MDNVNKQEAPLLKVDLKSKNKKLRSLIKSEKIRVIACLVIALYMFITTISCVVAVWEFVKPESLF